MTSYTNIFKVLVSGDRNWTDENKMLDSLGAIEVDSKTEIVIIEGEAAGADTMARILAERIGWDVIKVPANWNKYGKSAGPIRNQEMLDLDPDLVLAFHSDLANSKGTKDMVNRARKKGVKVIVIS